MARVARRAETQSARAATTSALALPTRVHATRAHLRSPPAQRRAYLRFCNGADPTLFESSVDTPSLHAHAAPRGSGLRSFRCTRSDAKLESRSLSAWPRPGVARRGGAAARRSDGVDEISIGRRPLRCGHRAAGWGPLRPRGPRRPRGYETGMRWKWFQSTPTPLQPLPCQALASATTRATGLDIFRDLAEI